MTSMITVPEPLQALRFKHLMTLKLDIAAVQKISAPDAGTIIGVVSGGRFEGPQFEGRVLAGGSDWQRVLPDGSLRLDCRIVLETTQGELIAMTYQGVRSGSPEVLKRLAAGEAVGADEYYLRIAPCFETRSSEHDWLNRVVAVGAGHRLPDGPIYNVFEVL